MYVINQVVRNYGISIVLFTLVVKLLMFPASYNQQKNMALMQTINPKIAKLKKSFSNNPQKLQMEQSKLMQEEGINPYASCLPTIITMFVLMGVYRVVNRPLTHILHLKDQAGEAQTLLSAWLAEHDMTEKYMSSRPELIIMQYADSHPEIFSSMNGFVEKVKGFDNSILGIIDLGAQPSLHPDGGWTGTAIALAAIPFLSGLIQLFLTIYSQYHQKKTNPDAPNMGGMTAMLYIMPIFSIVFAFSVPAGVGFYWDFLFLAVADHSLYRLLHAGALRAHRGEGKREKQGKEARLHAAHDGTAATDDGAAKRRQRQWRQRKPSRSTRRIQPRGVFR